MTEPHSEPPSINVPVEIDAKAVRSEAVRAVRVIRERSRQEHAAAPAAGARPTSTG